MTRRVLRQTVVGLLMLPLSLVPFWLYFGRTAEGSLLWAKVETAVAPPQAQPLGSAERASVTEHAPRYEGRVALLVYHGLGSGSDGDAQGDFTLSPERFAEQLVTLRTAGLHAVTARDVALAFTGQKELPPNAVMISFDDGRTDALLYADPIMRQVGMRATMFAIASAASDPGVYYAPWDALRDAARSGRWDIQSHSTDSHRHHEAVDGRSLPVLTSQGADETETAYEQRVHTDLVEASSEIEREVGAAPLAFAYPFGAYGADRASHGAADRVVSDAVGATNVVAFHQDGQDDWTLATCSDLPLGLRRLEVGDWTGRQLLGRIAAAAERRPSGYTCTDTYHSGAGQEYLRSLPTDLQAAVRTAVADDPDAALLDLEALRREWPRLPGVGAPSGDAIGDCQVVGMGCAARTPRPEPVLEELLIEAAPGAGDAVGGASPASPAAPPFQLATLPPLLAAPAAAAPLLQDPAVTPAASAPTAPLPTSSIPSPATGSGSANGGDHDTKTGSDHKKPGGSKKKSTKKH